MANFLIILPSDLIGGAENNLMKVARVLADKNKVDVVFLSKRNVVSTWDEVDGINRIYINVKRERYGFFYFFIYFIKSKIKSHYDYSLTSHIHCNAFLSILITLKIIKVDCVVLRESTDFFSWFSGYKLFIVKALYFLYFKKAHIICQTQKMEFELKKNLPFFHQRNVTVVENPVDYSRIKISSEKKCKWVEFIRRKSSNKKVLVSVGRLVEEKAYDVLIDAVSKISDEYLLIIVGDGKLKNKLIHQVDILELGERVFFTGELENPFPLMKEASLCIVSSRLEGFPNVLLEMMALSKCVISTLCAGGIENIPGIITCPINDSNALSDRIIFANSLSDADISDRAIKMKKYIYSLRVENFIRKIFSVD